MYDKRAWETSLIRCCVDLSRKHDIIKVKKALRAGTVMTYATSAINKQLFLIFGIVIVPGIRIFVLDGEWQNLRSTGGTSRTW